MTCAAFEDPLIANANEKMRHVLRRITEPPVFTRETSHFLLMNGDWDNQFSELVVLFTV